MISIPRSFRSVEFAWLLVALIISVASLSSVAYLADRMQRAFERDAKQLIAADVLVQADQPIPEQFEKNARLKGLSTAQTIVFPTMSSFKSQTRLVALKAVSNGYPLRGVIKTSDSLADLKGVATTAIPNPGAVWVDSALMPSLNINIGDELALGQAKFKVEAIITQELDKGAGFLNFAPRVMIREDELTKTQLIGLGSRVTYRLLVSGDERDIAKFTAWADQEIQDQQLRGIKSEGVDNSQPLMRATLDRAEKFLSLVAILTAMVAAVAMALAAKRYITKQAQSTAIWKCLGASRQQVLWEHGRASLFIALIGGVGGAFLGWLGHQALLYFLGDLLVSDLPPASIWPLIWSVMVSIILLIGFVWPPLLSLSQISPLRVIRKEVIVNAPSAWLLMFLGLATFFGLLLLVAKDLKLASLTLGGFGLAAILFVGVAWLIVKLAANLAEHTILGRDVVQRFAWQSLSRRSLFTGLQIASLAIAIMALLLLAVVRQDLLQAWKSSSPPDAPNRFLINIQPEQKNQLEKDLLDSGVQKVTLYPMIRGRLTHINEQLVLPQNYQDGRAQRLVDREFNLSYAAELPEKNKVVAGSWHGNTTQAELSIEAGIAKTLQLKLGDQLMFDIAGLNVQAKITSIRQLDWGSMRVNFFAILPSTLMSDMPQTWITAYRQTPSKDKQLPIDIALVAKFPNITVVDVESALNQVQDVLDRLSAAIELLFLFTIAAGVLVLGAALGATQDERLKDAALLKTLGASRTQIQKSFFTELLVIGFISGSLAGGGAVAVGWGLAHFVFEMSFPIPWIVFLYGTIFGMVICLMGGLWLQRKISNTSSMEVLRQI
jgi:putative ABC transport system permease protein